jgi:hypothetical protein
MPLPDEIRDLYMVAAPSLALTDGISTAADRATRFLGYILVNSKPAVFVEAHETCHAAHANLPTADWKRAAKLRAVVLLAESRRLTTTCNLQMSATHFLQIATSSAFASVGKLMIPRPNSWHQGCAGSLA